MKHGIIRAVCVSETKGTEKINVHRAVIRENWGLEGDAHAGPWHRQVSLLSLQKVREFNLLGACVSDGAFGENLLVDGIDCAALPVGTRLRCGDILLEVTQIGKECHSDCAIRQRVGTCIMPHQGIFARVLRGGEIREGDTIVTEEDTAGA
ncbi:MAG: MOSC domain-containing protein [Clostridia bacterium]|nr:MOSC domain-containing protein [Clostridia bacterium]